MTRPTQVSVAAVVYEIRWYTDMEWRMAGERDDWGGCTDHEKGYIAIRVSEDRHEDTMRETLLHEITHAVWAQIGLNHYPGNDSDEQEEYIVASSTPTLLATLQNNPDVAYYLLRLTDVPTVPSRLGPSGEAVHAVSS